MLKRLFGIEPSAAAPRTAPGSGSVLDQHVRTAPSPQNAIDIFAGDWISIFPEERGVVSNGSAALFNDERVAWAIDVMGGVAGQRVLELGPLEGGHSTLLERRGAREIVAIESNTRAYLRCLITKEIMGLTRTRFLCGDFLEYLRRTSDAFDACLASGVLYHQALPPELVALLARIVDKVFVWTHYYDRGIVERGALARHHVFDAVPTTCEGFSYTAHRYAYRAALEQSNFSGGPTAEVTWMTRDDILGAFRHFGFSEMIEAPDELDHPHGPAMMFVAMKPPRR
jgi:hypothetical protein